MVTLIGTGPGMRGLLAPRAAEAIREADVVLRGPDVSAEVLTLARAEAAVRDAAAESEANARALAAAAAAGKVVVRLYPGDALTSPAGGAEARALTALGVLFEVIPGIPLETAAATFAGVLPAADGSLTMLRPGAAASVTTLALGAAAADAVQAMLAERSASAPGVRVVDAGRSTQRVLPTSAAAHSTTADGIVLVPASERLEWFERRPLFGRRIVVTRPRAQAQGFVAWLEAQGAEPVEFPAIRIVPPPDPAPLADAAARVRDFDWLVLTSVNGVERFWDALSAAGLDSRALGGARVAAIGPATAAALEAHGVRADVVPERYVAEAVLEAMAETGQLAGSKVLLPRAHGAREVLPQELQARGATVSEVEAYRAVADTGAVQDLRSRLTSGQIDAVTFTSSSTVRNFVDAVGTELGGAIVACIGPVTAEAARTAGFLVSVVATEYTIPGLAAALRAFFAARPASPGQGTQTE